MHVSMKKQTANKPIVSSQTCRLGAFQCPRCPFPPRLRILIRWRSRCIIHNQLKPSITSNAYLSKVESIDKKEENPIHLSQKQENPFDH